MAPSSCCILVQLVILILILRNYVPPNRTCDSTKLHGITFQKIVLSVVIAVGRSDLTKIPPDYGLLGCDAMYLQVLTCRRNLFSPSGYIPIISTLLPWRWRQRFPPKDNTTRHHILVDRSINIHRCSESLISSSSVMYVNYCNFIPNSV
jgi:hypothetical protein